MPIYQDKKTKKCKFRTYADYIYRNRKQFERKGFSTGDKLNFKPQSCRATISRFDNHILPYFKDYRLNNITNSVYIKRQQKIEEKALDTNIIQTYTKQR